MKKAGSKIGAAVLAGAICLSAGGISAFAAEKEETPILSHGLQILSAATDMALSAPVGNEIVFSADAFARALNLSKVNYITVISLPENTAGELLLGSTRLSAGQTVSADNLAYMTFSSASEEASHSYFTFTANGGNIPMVCNLYLVDGVNYTPTVSMASGLSLKVSTHKDLLAHGTLSAYDPDGDALRFEIVSYPQNGALKLTDATAGGYVYKPNNGYVGSDSFSYVARDKYGNYSAAATVNLKVTLSGTAITYADMENSKAYNAALTLTEKGIMSGTQVGNQYYFSPEESVSRVDFLVMAMHAAGITEVPDCEQTVFADDASIPESMKGYVATAHELGYISGSLSNGVLSFLPDEEITRAQAALILSNIVGLCEVPVTPTFADHSDIPVWAADAIYSLNAAGILNPEQGYIAPTQKLTRAQTAQMLAAAMAYLE